MFDSKEKKIFIIGGGEIYRQAMPLATNLYITHIEADAPDADTFFPEIKPEKWHCTEKSTMQTDPKSGVNYFFADYTRK